jgi:two-component system chemotaxis sensor kinase CheA
MTIDISQFFQAFFDETDELLARMEKLLLAIDLSAPDAEDLNAIFRAAHSIKGSAGTFNFTDLSDFTHLLESLLDKIRKGEMTIKAEHIDAFLAAKDVLKMQLNGHRHGEAVDQEAVADISMLLQSLSQDAALHSPAAGPERSDETASSEMHRYRIALPQIAEDDFNALAAELGLLGDISKEIIGDNGSALVLDTAKSADDIAAICLFVLEPDHFEITGQTETTLSKTSADEAQQGYGFFEPLEPAMEMAAATPSADSVEKELGYGFFEPFKPYTAEAGADAASKIDPSADDVPAQEKNAVRQQADKPAGNPESSSIRVGIEKVDELINLVGELVITQAMIEQRTNALDTTSHERLLNGISQLTRNTRDLQEAVMSIRMMPMNYVFSRFPRMVRDLAAKLGKKVELVTHGAATELDKGLIERIVDPLTHLVRNSIDHGIEMPAARIAAGKSETGKLLLSARHHGGNIVIEVTDDGGGLSRQKILAKARQRDPSMPDSMTDADVFQLIFAPGFSTAETVTDVSGRGVGMDVVKRNITAMGGSIDIRSALGSGTTISISLPLTLAILDGMSVRVGGEIYILPLGYVIESLQPAAACIKQIAGQGRVVKVRGEYLPLIALHQMFGIEPRFTDPSEGIVVILESDGKKGALLVDELVGQQQVVVKNIESNYRKVAGISGATILGDGGVSLIIDVAALLRSSRQVNEALIVS